MNIWTKSYRKATKAISKIPIVCFHWSLWNACECGFPMSTMVQYHRDNCYMLCLYVQYQELWNVFVCIHDCWNLNLGITDESIFCQAIVLKQFPSSPRIWGDLASLCFALPFHDSWNHGRSEISLSHKSNLKSEYLSLKKVRLVFKKAN